MAMRRSSSGSGTLLREIEGPLHVELLDRGPVVQQLQELDLRRPQVHFRGLQIGLVGHALQLQTVQIHARDIAGFVAVLADA
jgi:hypothetical protein